MLSLMNSSNKYEPKEQSLWTLKTVLNQPAGTSNDSDKCHTIHYPKFLTLLYNGGQREI